MRLFGLAPQLNDPFPVEPISSLARTSLFSLGNSFLNLTSDMRQPLWGAGQKALTFLKLNSKKISLVAGGSLYAGLAYAAPEMTAPSHQEILWFGLGTLLKDIVIIYGGYRVMKKQAQKEEQQAKARVVDGQSNAKVSQTKKRVFSEERSQLHFICEDIRRRGYEAIDDFYATEKDPLHFMSGLLSSSIDEKYKKILLVGLHRVDQNKAALVLNHLLQDSTDPNLSQLLVTEIAALQSSFVEDYLGQVIERNTFPLVREVAVFYFWHRNKEAFIEKAADWVLDFNLPVELRYFILFYFSDEDVFDNWSLEKKQDWLEQVGDASVMESSKKMRKAFREFLAMSHPEESLRSIQSNLYLLEQQGDYEQFLDVIWTLASLDLEEAGLELARLATTKGYDIYIYSLLQLAMEHQKARTSRRLNAAAN